MLFGEMMESCQRWTYRCHPKVIIDRNQTKSKLDYNQEKYQNKSVVDLILTDMLEWTRVKLCMEMYQKESM